MKKYDINPDSKGYFWSYGWQILPLELQEIFNEIAVFYDKLKLQDDFKNELNYLLKHYVGRPSPLYLAKKLSDKYNWAQIYLKREDLNHTWAHKINHTLWECLLAKRMWKKKVIAETWAWQHWVALAAAAALVWIDCEIFMWEVDIIKEAPNVNRMKILWAKVTPVTAWAKTLKEAVDAAINYFASDPKNIFFAIGSIVGPHPFPMIVRDFQKIVGTEVRGQFTELTWKKVPDCLVACVGWWSNAIGLFSEFLEEKDVEIYWVEPSWKWLKLGNNAATLTLGTPWDIHGMHTYLLQDKDGNPASVYSIASWLDYPWVWPQHSFLKDTNRVNYVTASDEECVKAFFELSKLEWIIPALESAHALAFATKLATKLDKSKNIVVNLSGRWDKDIDYILSNYGNK
jgi:tryptophan synthase beta chain